MGAWYVLLGSQRGREMARFWTSHVTASITCQDHYVGDDVEAKRRLLTTVLAPRTSSSPLRCEQSFAKSLDPSQSATAGFGHSQTNQAFGQCLPSPQRPHVAFQERCPLDGRFLNCLNNPSAGKPEHDCHLLRNSFYFYYDTTIRN